MNSFTPTGATVNVAATATTGSVALGAFSSSGGSDIRVYNAGAAMAFIAFGGSTKEAAVTDLPVPAGAIEVFSVGPAVTHVAAITASGTATVYATPGAGT